MTLFALANLVQQAAGDDASTFALSSAQLFELGLGWVLSRQRMQIRKRPGPDQDLQVATWTSGRDRTAFFRDVVVSDGDGSPCLRATSAWILVDLNTLKPIAPPDWLLAAVPPPGPRTLTFETRTVPSLQTGQARSAPIRARRSDLDINGHVNNAHVLTWMLEPLDLAEPTAVPHDLDIVFRAECRHGESYTALAADQGTGRWLHSLRDAETGRERARAASIWTEPAAADPRAA